MLIIPKVKGKQKKLIKFNNKQRKKTMHVYLELVNLIKLLNYYLNNSE